MPDSQAEHTRQTREAYDRLAAVWSSITDEGPSQACELAGLVAPALAGRQGLPLAAEL